MSLAETAELVAELNLRGNFAQVASKAQKALGTLDKGTTRLRQNLSHGARELARNGLRIGAVLGGVGTVAFKMAADFEEQLRTINTVAGVTDDQLGAIGQSMLRMSRETGTALGDLTGAYYDLVSAGVKAADAQGILTQANTLAIGGLSTTGEAVDLLTTAINSYGLEASEARRITDGFAQAIAAGKVTAAEIAASFARVAPAAANAGIEIDELQAAYAQMTAAGIPAAEVATDIRAAITALQKPTKYMKELQESLNVDFEEMARDKGLAYTYDFIRRAADKQGISMVALTGRLEGTAYANAVAGRNARGYARNLELVRHASDGAGVAARQFQERQKGANAALRRLRETARDVAITFGTGLLPGATRGFDALATVLQKNRRRLRALGEEIGTTIKGFFSPTAMQGEDQGSVVLIASPFEKATERIKGVFDSISTLPWDAIKDSLRISAEVGQKALDIFMGLPPEVQAGLITLLAANKLTGGALASLGKTAIDLALKAVSVINAGNVTVIGKTVTGPGGVPGGGGGGNGAPLPVLGGAGIGVPQDVIIDRGLAIAKGLTLLATFQAAANHDQQRAADILAGIRGVLSGSPGVPLAPVSNDILDAIAKGTTTISEDGEETKRGVIQVGSHTMSVVRQLLRAIPIIGGVRDGVSDVANVVRNKDLRVQLSVTNNISAVTYEGAATTVRATNRFIAS